MNYPECCTSLTATASKYFHASVLSRRICHLIEAAMRFGKIETGIFDYAALENETRGLKVVEL